MGVRGLPLRGLVFQATVLCLLLGACGAGPGAKAERVVVILVDTLRADHLSSYGFPFPTTPDIDALAAQGVLFENAVTTAPWTLPAAASLLTGEFPSTHGAGRRTGAQRPGGEPPKAGLGPGIPTLPERLQAAGFRTASFFDNPYLGPAWGLTRGFETAVRSESGGQGSVDAALEWLEGTADAPAFLLLHLMEPHRPYDPPARFLEATERWVSSDASHARVHRRYLGEVAYTDHLIGTFLDGLEARGLLDDTLLILTSDHGEEFGEHAEIERERYNDPRELWGVGHGHSQFEELVAVPLVMRFPRGWRGGTRVEALAQLPDLVPTILEHLELPVPPGLAGVSLLPSLAGAEPRTAALSEFILYGDDRQSVREGPWKLIAGSDGQLELYDLAVDPGEKTNRAAEDQTRATRLARELRALQADAMLRAESLGLPGPPVDVDRETLEELRRLGYVQ